MDLAILAIIGDGETLAQRVLLQGEKRGTTARTKAKGYTFASLPAL